MSAMYFENINIFKVQVAPRSNVVTMFCQIHISFHMCATETIGLSSVNHDVETILTYFSLTFLLDQKFC